MKASVPALLAAALLGTSAGAAEIDNPACRLLTEDEARMALDGTAAESEINPEMTGTSDCGWTDAGGDAIALNLARGMAFQGSTTPDDGYRALYRSYAAGGTREDIAGIGEAAFLFTPAGVKPGAQYVAGFLRQGCVVMLATHGVGRAATLDLAAAAAGRVEPPRQ